jgi:hypothetical protein
MKRIQFCLDENDLLSRMDMARVFFRFGTEQPGDASDISDNQDHRNGCLWIILQDRQWL